MKTNKGLFTLFATSFLTLTGCGMFNGGGELNNYQKVAKAFTAVVETLNLSSNNKKSLAPHRALRAIDIHGDMSGFETYFANAETDEKIEDQIDFDTPPLMQFQYLKVIYDTIGGNYSFDTKYSHTITGSVYIDFETGFKDKEKLDENKYDFTFDLSVYVNIDEEDLITADVGMDITLTHEGESYKYYKYALLVLDYDFKQSSDNYELALYDYGEETDLAYLHCDYGYEYDYCLVTKGKLIEWRKFRYEADHKMVKDARHPTLDSYINEGTQITTSNQRWYKDKVLRTIRSNRGEALEITKALYAGFGMNNTDLNPEGYFAKSSTDSSVIQTIYNQSSKAYGDELIYHIVAKDEEDDHKDGNGWPTQDVEQIAGGLGTITFSNKEGITYQSRRDDVDGESTSVIITVSGATSSDYEEFERRLLTEYNLNHEEDQSGFHVYSMGLIDNTTVSVLVSPSANTIVFTHYFGGGGTQNPYEPIELENMITYDLPYNSFYQSYFTVEKEVFDVLSQRFDDKNIDKVLTKKINVEKSQKVVITISEKDLEYISDAKNVKDARDKVMNQYIGYYKDQWTSSNYVNVFVSSDNKDVVFFEAGNEEQDNLFTVYFFRCYDDTLELYVKDAIERYIDIEIYVHSREGDGYVYDTIAVQNGQSVLPYLNSDVNYYLDDDLTILVTEENSYAYEGMVLHRRDYDDPVYEKISVPGGIDYELPYTWKLVNEFEDEEEIYNRVTNMVGDPNLRPYLEGNVSSSNKTNQYYQIFIGDDVATYLGKTSFVEAAKYLLAQYNKEYSSWNIGKKGDYFYTGERGEDVVFFAKEHLGEGMIEFIHLHLNTPVMANYESGGSGGGDTPTTARIPVIIYKDGVYDTTEFISAPVGDDVRNYLIGYEGNFYLDSSFTKPLDDSNCTVSEGMILFNNIVSGSQDAYVIVTVIINGSDGNVNVVEVSAKVGDDVLDWVSTYADEFYYDAEYKTKINKGECLVSADLVIYGKTNQGGGGDIPQGLVTVYIYQDGSLYDQHIFTAAIGDDVRPYLEGYGEGIKYVDESFSTLLDDSNCTIYDGMNIYIVINSETPVDNTITIPVYLFDSNGNKLGMKSFTCKIDEDIRGYLRDYDGDFFLDADFTIQLTFSNCKAQEGMAIYVRLRNK